MIIHEATIPSAFIRQDTRINDADQFANVASLQRLRLNHNILLAQRVRKVLATLVFKNGGIDTIFYCTGAASAQLGTPIVSILFKATPGIKEIVVVMRAKKTSSTSVKLYGWTEDEKTEEDFNSGVSVTINNASYAKFSMTVPVARLVRGHSTMRLNIVADGFMEGADLIASATVTGAGHDYIDGQIGADYTGGVIYSPTDVTITPRRVVRYMANINAANDDRLYVQPAWNKIPAVNTDTVNIRAAGAVAVETIVLYEDRVAAFFNETSQARV